MFYEWSSSPFKFAEYGGKTEQDERSINWFDSLMGDPLPPLAEWVTPNLEQYLGGDKKKRKPRPIGDAPTSAAVHFVSEKAAIALKDIFDKHALLYPVHLCDAPDDRYFMVVCHTILDVLDRERSEGIRAKYSKNPEHFASIHNWVFYEEKIGDADMFMLPDNKTYTFVSERFKQKIIEAGLIGFILTKEFMDDTPFISGRKSTR